TFDQAGSYVLQVTVSDSQDSAPVSGSVLVKVEQAISVTASASPAQIAGTSTNLIGTFNGDGIAGDAAGFQWSKISGAGNVSFSNASQLTNTASFDQSGIYVLQLAAAQGGQAAQAVVNVAVNASMPTALKLTASPSGMN